MYCLQASEPDSRPPAGVLLAPEGTADLGATGADVHVGDATVTSEVGQESFRGPHRVGEDRTREPVTRHSFCSATASSKESTR